MPVIPEGTMFARLLVRMESHNACLFLYAPDPECGVTQWQCQVCGIPDADSDQEFLADSPDKALAAACRFFAETG